jgi:hypothetical protein
MPHKHCFRAFAAACVALALAITAQACNVPVFRFALEHWRADPYRVTLLHEGPLSQAELELIRPLEEQDDRLLANLTFRTVDVSELDEEQRERFASQPGAELPRLVVQYPEHLRIEAPVWTGPLAKKAIAQLTDSPARQELVRRLAEGQTAVWLLLECGDAEKDNAAAARVERENKLLETSLPLPELSASPEDQLLAGVPLRVAFSVLRVSRDDPAEKALAAMLLHCEPDLLELSEPMVFPVFGRGRALLPLVGAGITAENIRESAAFLVGPCSCQVKELNPGFDLLLADEWDTLISYEGPPPPLASAAPLNDDPVLVPIPSGATDESHAAHEEAHAASDESHAHGVIVTADAAFTTWSRKLLIVGGIAVAGLVLIVGLAAMALGGGETRRRPE